MSGSRDCTTTAEIAGWVTCSQTNPANSLSGSNKYTVRESNRDEVKKTSGYFQPQSLNQNQNRWLVTKVQCVETCRGVSTAQYLYAVFSAADKSCHCTKVIPTNLPVYTPTNCQNRNYKVLLNRSDFLKSPFIPDVQHC